MQLLIQTTHIHKVRTNIAIIRFRVDRNRNNLITELIVHLNYRYLMLGLPVVDDFIDTRNTLAYISNSLCLLRTVYLRSTTLMLWTISSKVVFATSPTMHELLTLILRLLSLSSI